MNIFHSQQPGSKPGHFFQRLFGCAILIFLCTQSPAQEMHEETIKIQIDPKAVMGSISENFMGLGYETSAVAQPNYFTPKNTTLVRLYRNLSHHGLIRIGGIISDHTRYVPAGLPAALTQTEVTVINRANLADLGAFARAVNWQVMWGLNLGTGSRKEAVKEAVAIHEELGSSLQSFEIGNEVEALQRFAHNYDDYHAAYLDYKTGIRSILPKSDFSGPDSIGNLSWITNFAATESGDIKLLTQHYYRGDGKDPKTTLEKLLTHDEGWDKRLEKLREIGRERGIAFRINEVNSFSSGGKPGVSDTFGSALWCLDYMFILASYGCEGINLETDINQLGFISHYSPIVHDATGHCSVRPDYYAILAFAMAGHGELLRLNLNTNSINLSAYATKADDGTLWLTFVNKDFSRDAGLEVNLPEHYSHAAAFRLSGPSMESTEHTTFAGAEVSADGTWSPKPPEPVVVNRGVANLRLPHASGILLKLSHK